MSMSVLEVVVLVDAYLTQAVFTGLKQQIESKQTDSRRASVCLSACTDRLTLCHINNSFIQFEL